MKMEIDYCHSKYEFYYQEKNFGKLFQKKEY